MSTVARWARPRRAATATPPTTAKAPRSAAANRAAARTNGSIVGPGRWTVASPDTAELRRRRPIGEHLSTARAIASQLEGHGERMGQRPAALATRLYAATRDERRGRNGDRRSRITGSARRAVLAPRDRDHHGPMHVQVEDWLYRDDRRAPFDGRGRPGQAPPRPVEINDVGVGVTRLWLAHKPCELGLPHLRERPEQFRDDRQAVTFEQTGFTKCSSGGADRCWREAEHRSAGSDRLGPVRVEQDRVGDGETGGARDGRLDRGHARARKRVDVTIDHHARRPHVDVAPTV